MCSGRPHFDALAVMRSMAQVAVDRRGVLIWSAVLGLLQAGAGLEGYERRVPGDAGCAVSEGCGTYGGGLPAASNRCGRGLQAASNRCRCGVSVARRCGRFALPRAFVVTLVW